MKKVQARQDISQKGQAKEGQLIKAADPERRADGSSQFKLVSQVLE